MKVDAIDTLQINYLPLLPMKLPDQLKTIVPVLGGLGFVGFGIYLMIDPIAGLAQFGLSVPEESSNRVELRAFYGGLEIGIGLILLKFALNKGLRRAALWLLLGSYGGLGVARAAAMLLESEPATSMMWSALAVELGFAAAAIWLLALGGDER
ncbi:MAG: DUF4345 family protein [Pseudomonadota bacterium]